MAKQSRRDRPVLHPYMSYKTFRNHLDSLRHSKVPARFDSSVFPSMNGMNRSLIISTLRYFGLISANDIPTPELHALVKYDSEEAREQIWSRLVKDHYADVFKADLDIRSATTKQMTDVLGKRSSAETARKSVLFFCAAARDAGIEISPHVKPYARRQRARASSKMSIRTKSVGAGRANGGADQPRIPNLPEFDQKWPEPLKEKWLEAYSQLLRRINGEHGAT